MSTKIFADTSRPIRPLLLEFAESAVRAQRAVVSPMGYEAGLHYVPEAADFEDTIPVQRRDDPWELDDPAFAMDRANERSGMQLLAWFALGLVVAACFTLSWAAWAKFVVAA